MESLTNPFGLWRIIRHTKNGDIIGPWVKNKTQTRIYDLAMGLLNSEQGYHGYQYLAVGTGSPDWDLLPTPPEAAPDAPHLYPYNPPAQQERLIFLNNPTGGNFSLSFNGQTTSLVAYDPNASGSAKAAVMQAVLQSLSTVGVGNLVVAAEGGDSYLITFMGQLGSGPQPLITATSSGLTGTNSPTISTLLVNSPLVDVLGEFARFPIDNYTYIDENKVPLISGISRYVQLSVTIPQSTMAPINPTDSPVVFRELAWVGGNATAALGTGMYLYIVRFPKETRRYGDTDITIQSRVGI